jgi:hypothetical protein
LQSFWVHLVLVSAGEFRLVCRPSESQPFKMLEATHV